MTLVPVVLNLRLCRWLRILGPDVVNVDKVLLPVIRPTCTTADWLIRRVVVILVTAVLRCINRN